VEVVFVKVPPLFDQTTAVLPVPVTVAVKTVVEFAPTVADEGAIVMPTWLTVITQVANFALFAFDRAVTVYDPAVEGEVNWASVALSGVMVPPVVVQLTEGEDSPMTVAVSNNVWLKARLAELTFIVTPEFPPPPPPPPSPPPPPVQDSTVSSASNNAILLIMLIR
jgi:hypothetical protein